MTVAKFCVHDVLCVLEAALPVSVSLCVTGELAEMVRLCEMVSLWLLDIGAERDGVFVATDTDLEAELVYVGDNVVDWVKSISLRDSSDDAVGLTVLPEPDGSTLTDTLNVAVRDFVTVIDVVGCNSFVRVPPTDVDIVSSADSFIDKVPPGVADGLSTDDGVDTSVTLSVSDLDIFSVMV